MNIKNLINIKDILLTQQYVYSNDEFLIEVLCRQKKCKIFLSVDAEYYICSQTHVHLIIMSIEMVWKMKGFSIAYNTKRIQLLFYPITIQLRSSL